MKQIRCVTVFILAALMFVSFETNAQNPENWTKDQLIEPSALAQILKNEKDIPVIFSVGPGASIPNSVDIGMVNDKDNLSKFKNKLSSLSKETNIVIYCGCCPFEHCPNVRPAIEALKEMKFVNYKLLNLSHNLKADWIDKGYPTKP